MKINKLPSDTVFIHKDKTYKSYSDCMKAVWAINDQGKQKVTAILASGLKIEVVANSSSDIWKAN